MPPRTDVQFEKMREMSRRKIIDAALEVFATYGFHSTSMDRIASKARISKGLIYNYYKSKNELLEAVIFGKMMHLMEGAMSGVQKQASPAGKIKQLINMSFEMLEADPKFWKLYWSVLFDPKLPKSIVGKIKEMTSGFMLEVEEMLRQNGVKNARAEAHILPPTLDAINMMVVFGLSDYPVEEIRKCLVKRYCG